MNDMTPDNQPTDPFSSFSRRIAGEEEVGQVIPEFSFQDPLAVGIMFCEALDDPEENFVALSRLVTPESLPTFGDFKETAGVMAGIQNVGHGSRAARAVGDDCVAYFKILSGVTRDFQVLEEQVVSCIAILTLVWRAEFGEWRVHWIGDYVKPEDVPH